MSDEKFKLIIFAIYTILYELLIWSLFLYLIVVEQWSEWTIIVAMIMSNSQLQPIHFGLNYKVKDKVKEDVI